MKLDNRKILRWQVNKKAKIRLEGAVSDADCYIKDINLKGMQVVFGQRLVPDTYIKFSLTLSSEISISVEAWVVWHKIIENKNIYGMYFTKISREDKDKIYKFVYQNLPEKAVKGWSDSLIKKDADERVEDNRIFQRFNLKLPVRLLDLNTGEEIPAETNDIGGKGLGLRLKQELKINTPLEAWIHFPDKEKPLYIRGVSVWSKLSGVKEYRAGIKIDSADLMGLSRIMKA